MAAKTVTEVVTTTILTTSLPSSTLKATPQGGILEGSNPSVYDPKNPIILFIIQAGIVLIFCRLLHWPLSKLRQPRVIAEVIGGILLGPSVMGRIPGFTDAIFPSASIPNFTLVANLGLILFLFLVGLEVDLRFLVSNWKIALSVGAAGMALPFGLGCAIAWGLYNQFHGDEGTVPIGFGTYMLFIAIAMAITAFPVLCRILTELKLLGTPVGIIVLSAGVGNDVIGWILLALCVALVNASDGLTALWVLLTATGYTLFLVFIFRPGFVWYLRRTRSIDDGPSQAVVALTLLVALASAFFTGVIGIHPIFGAFMAGLICPHQGGFAIKVTEKVEDMVSVLFLPLYFALSGLSTNLGLLNNGITWAYVIGVIAVAFCGKVIGGSGAARLNGLVWRECFAIGALMSCKGLVELIVLNIGLQAKILSTRTFTIFVLMALVTTFATTPLVSFLYPPWYQQKLDLWKQGLIDWETGQRLDGSDDESARDPLAAEKAEAANVHKVLMYLRLDSMPGLMALTSLFGGANQAGLEAAKQSSTQLPRENPEPVKIKGSSRAIEVHAVRLLELTERDSSVMKVSELEEYSAYDPVINTFRTFGRLHNVEISGEVTVVPESSFAETLAIRARDDPSDLMLIPWSETGSMSESLTVSREGSRKKLASEAYAGFVTEAIRNATCSTAIFVNNGFGGQTRYGPRRLSRTLTGVSLRSRPDTAPTPANKQGHHIFLAYFSSSDDRAAMRFVLQLARDPSVTATIVHFKTDASNTEDMDLSLIASRNSTSSTQAVTSAPTEAIPLRERSQRFVASIRASLSAEVASRIAFENEECTDVKEAVLDKASIVFKASGQNAGNLIAIGCNSIDKYGSCLGVVGDTLVENGIQASLIVLHAGRKS